MASTLNSDYPAFFAQFYRALTMARSPYFGSFSVNPETIERAADLLNATLSRIRRAIPGTPDALAQEIYSDSSGQLWSR
jgi:hypothetical protein